MKDRGDIHTYITGVDCFRYYGTLFSAAEENFTKYKYIYIFNLRPLESIKR